MRRLDLEVKLVNNGEQCVELFQEWLPDLIWMDMRMPVMGGEEATRRIRQLPGGKRVKIIAVTASAFKEEQQQILTYGMDDFVRKPFRFNEIYDCLARHLSLTFQYRSEHLDETAPVVLTSQMLSELPGNIRNQLSKSLISLDSEKIASLIKDIASIDNQLASILHHFCKYYDYQTILNALDELKP
jgi:CheY-like chemotaxis protein